jgi:hypothetical protein
MVEKSDRHQQHPTTYKDDLTCNDKTTMYHCTPRLVADWWSCSGGKEATTRLYPIHEPQEAGQTTTKGFCCRHTVIICIIADAILAPTTSINMEEEESSTRKATTERTLVDECIETDKYERISYSLVHSVVVSVLLCIVGIIDALPTSLLRELGP